MSYLEVVQTENGVRKYKETIIPMRQCTKEDFPLLAKNPSYYEDNHLQSALCPSYKLYTIGGEFDDINFKYLRIAIASCIINTYPFITIREIV